MLMTTDERTLTPGDDLARALDEAPAGAVFQLAAGEYRLPGTLRVDQDVTLRGAGRNHTRLVGEGADAVLHVAPGARLRVQGVELAHDGPAAADVVIVEGEADLEGCGVSGARLAPGAGADGPGGCGVRAVGRAGVTIYGCAISACGGHGAFAADDAALTVDGGTLAGNDGCGAVFAGRAGGEGEPGQPVAGEGAAIEGRGGLVADLSLIHI